MALVVKRADQHLTRKKHGRCLKRNSRKTLATFDRTVRRGSAPTFDSSFVVFCPKQHTMAFADRIKYALQAWCAGLTTRAVSDGYI